MKILYLHGIHAAPGLKVERLQQMTERTRVFAPVLHDPNLLRRLDQPGFLQILERAQSASNLFQPDLIVACSFGGAVALHLKISAGEASALFPTLATKHAGDRGPAADRPSDEPDRNGRTIRLVAPV